jgi:ABC-type methionine transport system ATPase subunit
MITGWGTKGARRVRIWNRENLISELDWRRNKRIIRWDKCQNLKRERLQLDQPKSHIVLITTEMDIIKHHALILRFAAIVGRKVTKRWIAKQKKDIISRFVSLEYHDKNSIVFKYPAMMLRTKILSLESWWLERA